MLYRTFCAALICVVALPTLVGLIWGPVDDYVLIVALVCLLPIGLPFLLKSRIVIGVLLLVCAAVAVFDLIDAKFEARFLYVSYPYRTAHIVNEVAIFLLVICTMPLLALALIRWSRSQQWLRKF